MMENTIAIVGGGFGGIRAALSLARNLKKRRLAERYKIALINRSPFHLYTPLLYKYAISLEFPREVVAIPLSSLFQDAGVQVLEDTVTGMDLSRGLIKLSSGKEIKARYVILAPGSETNWFGIPGLKENALTLKTAEDAEKIRKHLKTATAGMKVLVCGGGPNGTEIAAELAKNRRLKVTIIEAMPTLLPGFLPRMQKAAVKRLRNLGVEIILNEPVAEAQKKSIRTKSGRELPFDTLIWTGGIKVPEWLRTLPLQIDAKGRIEPGNGMECIARSEDLSLAPSVYAVGDAVCVHMKDGSPMPAVAHAAILQGEVAAANVMEDILGAEGLTSGGNRKKFSPSRYPYVMPTGGRYAIASIGPLILSGFLMWVFKEAITVKYFLSIMPLGRAIKLWRKGL